VAPTQEDPEHAAAPTLLYVIGRVSQGVRRELRARLRPWELSVPEYTALSVLRARPGLSNAQIARRSLITPQSMLEVLASLEERGLVVRRVDARHGRIRRAHLTARGRRALAGAERVVQALEEELFAEVRPDDRRMVVAGLVSAMGRLSSGAEPE
jgi:DNA-binding MarR family transcriptional regulator